MKATAEWFPAKERGLAGGLFNVGASVGSMLAPPLVARAILSYSWRAAFVITGVIGLAWAALWLWFYEAPDEHSSLSTEERDNIAAGQEKHVQGDGTRPSIRRIASRRNVWGIAVPRFLADPTWGTLTFWVPLYLSTVRGFDLKHIALFAWLPFLAADFGSMFGGLVSMQLQKRGVRLLDSRRWAFTLGACMMTGVAFVGFVNSPYAAIALISLAGFALPKGVWYDWWTNTKYTGGDTISLAVDLATMPIFVRAGAIIPVDTVRQYTSQVVTEPTTLRVYRGADGQYTLYDDDGVSQDYLKGAATLTRMSWNDGARRLTMSANTARQRVFTVEQLPDGARKSVTMVRGVPSVTS